MMERTYNLPEGPTVRVRVSADLADDQSFPILREDVAVLCARILLALGNMVKR